jgi:hypothetical protein
MASVLALVSKPLFGKASPKGVKVGDLFESHSYLSKHKTFTKLDDGGSIFLVTVRPPDEQLWLIAIIDEPVFKDDGWYGAENRTAIVDITGAIPKLVFSSGNGLAPKKGALGMSLQTPRVLTDADEKLLRGLCNAPVKTQPSEARGAVVKSAAKAGRLRFANQRKARPLAKMTAAEKKRLEDASDSGFAVVAGSSDGRRRADSTSRARLRQRTSRQTHVPAEHGPQPTTLVLVERVAAERNAPQRHPVELGRHAPQLVACDVQLPQRGELTNRGW